MKRLGIFASGSGTNAENICKYFENKQDITVGLILTNNPEAFVIERAIKLKIPYIIFNKEELNNGSVLQILQENKIDFIILAGFLWLIPLNIINVYNRKIVNIHPALLPKYGGKGMYGDNVHKKVIENGEKESGITIHYVNDKYDKGDIVFQEKCLVKPEDTFKTLADKVHQLEYEYYPVIIEKIIKDSL